MMRVSDGQSLVAHGGMVEPRGVPRTPTFHVANAVECWLLRKLGFAGVCWPWRRIAILPEWHHHETLRRHEAIHLEQIDRHGPITFTALWLWYTISKGYRNNPLEREAYRRQTER